MRAEQKATGVQLFVMDGCTSHVNSAEELKRLVRADIRALAMPSHTSSELQPLDVGIFGPLKAIVRQANTEENNRTLGEVPSKNVRATRIATALGRAARAENIVSAFAKSGLWPLDEGLVARLSQAGKLSASAPFRQGNAPDFERSVGEILFAPMSASEAGALEDVTGRLNLSPVSQRLRRRIPRQLALPATAERASKRHRVFRLGENQATSRELTDESRLERLSVLNQTREANRAAEERRNMVKSRVFDEARLVGVEVGPRKRMTRAILSGILRARRQDFDESAKVQDLEQQVRIYLRLPPLPGEEMPADDESDADGPGTEE